MMSKKSITFFAFIVLLVAGPWFYLASKFEKTVQEIIVPKLEKYSNVVDYGSLDVKKYKFTIELDDLKISPENEDFSLLIGKASVFYNPFTEKFTLNMGDKETVINVGDQSYYSKNSDSRLEFSKSVIDLNKDFNQFEVIYSSNGASLIHTGTDHEMLKFDAGEVKILVKNDQDGDIALKTNLDFDKILMSPMLSAEVYNLFYRSSSFLKGEDHDALVKYFDRMEKLTGPVDYKTSFELDLSKKFKESVFESLEKGDGSLSGDVLENIFQEILSIDKFNVKIAGNYSTKIEKFGILLHLHKKETDELIQGNIELGATKDLSEKDKIEYADILSERTLKNNKIIDQDDIVYDKDKLSAFVANSIVGIKHFAFKSNFAFDKNDNIVINFNTNVKINDYNLDVNLDHVKGDEGNAPKFVASIKQNKAGILFDDVVDLVLKAEDIISYKKPEGQEHKNLNIARLHYIRDHGFDLLKFFHNGDQLEKGDDLKAEIVLGLGDNNITVNGKDLNAIQSDPVVAGFLSEMPQ